MRVKYLVLLFLLILFQRCGLNDTVTLTNQVDPEIVLVNIEEGDRAHIGNLLLGIYGYKPKLIAVDAYFIDEKDRFQDSVLLNAFKIIRNDIITYNLDSLDKPLRSLAKFRSFVTDEGLAIVEQEKGLLSRFIPIKTIDSQTHEHFSLKILKNWKPDFKFNFEPNKSIPIKFTRSLEQFIHFDGIAINDIDSSVLKDKIVLVGYLGPRDEDKHYTPIRFLKKTPKNKPDTYGLVIVANQIRTIMNYSVE